MIYSIRSSARNVKRIKNYPLHKKVVQCIFLPLKNSAIIIFAVTGKKSISYLQFTYILQINFPKIFNSSSWLIWYLSKWKHWNSVEKHNVPLHNQAAKLLFIFNQNSYRHVSPNGYSMRYSSGSLLFSNHIGCWYVPQSYHPSDFWHTWKLTN